jgi:sporulation-control protein
MSFFQKMLASIGVGSARVDTRLEKSTFIPGEKVNGIVVVKGGNIEQTIGKIYLSVMTHYIKETDDKKYVKQAVLHKEKINQPFTIQANETKEIPFSFRLPFDTPITVGKTKVWVQTGLEIRNAMDPSDSDYIEVLPTPLMNAVLASVKELGFHLRKAECEEVPFRLRKRLPFVQEFEFFPQRGSFRGKLDEIEIIFSENDGDSLEIFLQIDRRPRGLGGLLAEALELDESFVRLKFFEKDIPAVKERIRQNIERYS